MLVHKYHEALHQALAMWRYVHTDVRAVDTCRVVVSMRVCMAGRKEPTHAPHVAPKAASSSPAASTQRPKHGLLQYTLVDKHDKDGR